MILHTYTPQVDLRRPFVFRHSKHEYNGIPIIASNMDTVGTFEMAKAIAKVSSLPLLRGWLKLSLLWSIGASLSFHSPPPPPQHDLFTTVHKHYSVEEWQAFAAENPNVLKVLLLLSEFPHPHTPPHTTCTSHTLCTLFRM